MKKRVSEEKILQLRELIEQVEKENENQEILPPSKRRMRINLSIAEWVMIIILCFAYFPIFLLGIGLSIITVNGVFIQYMFFAFAAVGPMFIVIWGIPLTMFFSFRYMRKKSYEKEVGRLFQIINQEFHIRRRLEDNEISVGARSLRNLVGNLRAEYDIEEFM